MGKGKVVLVTGAARGLGKEMALHFGNIGYHVAVNDVANLDKAEEVVEQIQGSGCESLLVQADIKDPGQVKPD